MSILNVRGAKAISVLTNQSWFGGSLEILKKTSMRKCTFPHYTSNNIVSEYQLLQGRIRGASASLILVYYFDEKELRQIVLDYKRIGLEPVAEFSLEKELPYASIHSIIQPYQGLIDPKGGEGM